MTELPGLVLLVGGLGALAATGALVACCLGLALPVEFVLAAYVLGWTWLVALALVLSPVAARHTRLGAGRHRRRPGRLRCSCGKHGRARHRRPFAPTLAVLLQALRAPIVLVLAVGIALGAAYSLALALFIPANDGDALAYHLARAAFWKQEHQLGYVANSVDLRLDVNPPNAEIGQLATMALARTDRFVALPQLGAYAVLVLCVAALARRIGLDAREAVFGALVFASLPIVLVQASSALNDLVSPRSWRLRPCSHFARDAYRSFWSPSRSGLRSGRSSWRRSRYRL